MKIEHEGLCWFSFTRTSGALPVSAARVKLVSFTVEGIGGKENAGQAEILNEGLPRSSRSGHAARRNFMALGTLGTRVVLTKGHCEMSGATAMMAPMITKLCQRAKGDHGLGSTRPVRGLIGTAFTRAKHAKEKTVVATTKDIGRLMQLVQRDRSRFSLRTELTECC